MVTKSAEEKEYNKLMSIAIDEFMEKKEKQLKAQWQKRIKEKKKGLQYPAFFMAGSIYAKLLSEDTHIRVIVVEGELLNDVSILWVQGFQHVESIIMEGIQISETKFLEQYLKCLAIINAAM